MGFFNSYAHEVKHDFWVKQCLVKGQFDSDSACKNKNLVHPSSLCKFGLPVTLPLTQSNLSIIATLETEVSGLCWNVAIMGRGRDVMWYQFLGREWKWNRSMKQIVNVQNKNIIKRHWVNPLFFMAVVSGRFRSSSKWGGSLFQTLR